MARALVYLDESLASSLALRFVDNLTTLMDLEPYIIHVVTPEENENAGTGWVRRTWESGVIESGLSTMSRLLKTEKVKCRFGGPPKVKIGLKDKEILDELRMRTYDLYIEGVLPTAKTEEFFSLLDSELYKKAPCPILSVKNLSISKTAAVLLGHGVDNEIIIKKLRNILEGSSIDLELVYFIYQEVEHLAFLDREMGGKQLLDVENSFLDSGIHVLKSQVIGGIPEQAGEYLMNYAFVVSSYLPRKALITEVLANTPASVLLLK